MRAYVICEIEGQDGEFELNPGDLIGRMELAALPIEDARISEAHAMISLREGELRLLALRGRFRVGQELCAQVSLEIGLRVELAQGITLHVLEVALPEQVLGLEVPGLARLILPQTMTLFEGSPPQARAGYDDTGAAIFWTVDGQHRVTIPGQPTRQIVAGDLIELPSMTARVVSVPLNHASRTQTRTHVATVTRLEVLTHGVRVHQEDHASALIAGLPGKILAALLTHGPTMSWEQLVEHVWPGDRSLEHALRRRFDCNLARLRARLQRLNLSPQLIRMSGTGLITVEPDHLQISYSDLHEATS